MQLKSWQKKALVGLISGSLTGCSLYVPMLPAAPQIRDKGQMEIHGTSFLNRRWEAGATYSPAKYVLVRAAGGIRTSPNQDVDSARYERSRQYEIGAGGYFPVGQNGLVSGLIGFGQAKSAIGYWDDGLFRPRFYNEYQMRYNRPFGELAASYYLPGNRSGFTLGIVYRLNSLDFSKLTYNGQPVALRRLTRQEAMVFCRFGRQEGGAVPWLRGQLAIGGSGSFRQPFDPSLPPSEFKVREEVPFMALTMVILPHLFRSSNR
ncbi:hypothetical protein [Hymenobacter terrestris]|uniref:DUF3575 domain-containing protein n=1 Tax=Hymenobacter terrestris TaxID=2748310 RepID=A0ABX2PYF2_9BACT|nr:hypothetical protein [Hymenobacter terrestris]NVO83710.1 hypothetical protein [Hymenobacter terrestris]